MIRLMGGVAALALPAVAAAQDSPVAANEEPIVLVHETRETIVVTGAGSLAPTASDSVQAVTLIRDVEPGFGARVENRLRGEAGIVQFRRSDGRSAHPTSQGVTLRGLGGNASSRAVVLLDGVPQADPFGGWVAWSGFDAVRLGGIRITRGGGGGGDGPGALAGTIALHSSLTYGAEASAAYGSRDAFDLSGSVGSNLGEGAIALDARFAGGDGFTPVVADQRGAADRAAGYRQGGGGIRLQALTGDSGRIEATVRGFFDRRDRGTDYSRSRTDAVDASVRYVLDPGFGDGWRASALAYVQLRDFDTGFASVAADRDSANPALDQHVPATGLGARFELRPAFGSRNPLRVGIDWRRTVGRTEESYFFTGLVPGRRRVAGGSSDTLGAFAEWTDCLADDRLVLTASGRLDRWWLGEGYRFETNIGGAPITDARFAARDGWEASGRVGVKWITGPLALRAAAYRGWRLPTLNELYRPFRVGPDATAANEALEPERLWGGEVGADWSAGQTKLGVTLFANRLSNAIANVTLGTGPGNFPGVGFVAAGATYGQRQNLDAIDSKGIEFSAEQGLGPFTIRATYAFTDAKVDASGAAATLDGRRPAQIAKHGGSVSLRSNAGGPFGGFATLRYIGKQNEDDLGLLALGDALTLDAGLSWRVTDAVSVEARGENLFDELVPAAISSAGIVERATPRTLWVGARLSF
ncbi:TonB-dependent receptor [Sphingopyxis sp. H115]|uniref:TonB-dependent receptor n=1 Tax=Sphingopyxis sp. H115 TaxID=1759073 RepID=UPI00073636D0|nr:TonB-dependent receptor [Sphingopyxis sp. H115]KTE10738.1 TonB-dependent receptor [Sphingopyxis sp. H115]